MVQGTEGTTMPFLARPRNPAYPAGLPQSPPSRGGSEPGPIDPWDYGFRRFIPLLQSPPFGASFLSLTVFFFIAFFSNILLADVTFASLGITVTLGTFGILALIILIQFLF